MYAEPSGQENQRVANVVAVANVSQFKAAQVADFFFQREEISERLARMKLVGQRINDWNGSASGHFVEYALFVNARDDALHPAFQVARHVGDGFALAQARLGVVKENHRATHGLDANLESDARAQRGLFKD